MSQAPPRVPKQRRPQDAALPAGSGSRLAGSPAWHGLPQCAGYGHWVSYCCVVLVFGFGFHGNHATPGWGLGCVCLGTGLGLAPAFLARVCAVCGWAWGSDCTPPFLAGVLGCVWLCARSSCTPPPPGWGLRRGCVCLGLGFGCAPPLLAGVLGCVCVCVPAPLLPRHSWLGCAVWVCLLGLGFWLRPASPGWGVGVCVCLCAHSACTPPLLAGVCGSGVCDWARLSAAPRQFLAPVVGCSCVCGPAPLVPRHFWLRCAVWVFMLGLKFRLHPATRGWVVGLCVCLCARSSCTPPLLAGMCSFGVCAWARVWAAPRHSCLGCSGVCVFAGLLRLYPATPGWGVRSRCVCLGSGFGCAPPLLAGVLGCVCVCMWAPPACTPPLLAGVLGCVCRCAPSACTPQLLAGVRSVGRCAWTLVSAAPATPGWGVGVFACLCARSACAPPLLAGVCGVGVCAWARVSAAPRHSWVGCMGLCVFVCTLLLYLPTPGCGVRRGCVCLSSGFSCALRPLAGTLRCVCACDRASLVPRHSWRGCAVWVCVLGLGFRLRLGNSGWGVGVCVCLRARSVCTWPLLAGVCGVSVCAWAWFRLRPASPGWGVWVCVCLCARSACTPPTPGWGVWFGCVRLGSGLGCAPPFLAPVVVTRSRGGPATGRCGGHAQVSRQAKHYAHRGINALMSCDKVFQAPCHSATRERMYVQQHIRICTHGVKTGLG